MNSHTKSIKYQLLTMAITLSFVSLAFVSIGNAQTATLNGKFVAIEYCDGGGGEAEKEKVKAKASIFVDFNAFPFVNAQITVPGEPTISLSGYALAKSSKKGVFGLTGLAKGSSIASAVAINGTYKLRGSTGKVKVIKGQFQNVWRDSIDKCISQGRFKLKG